MIAHLDKPAAGRPFINEATDTQRCDVSVVVCTHNRAAMLRDALASLVESQTLGEFRYEILVVDNASTDATPEVVAEAARNAIVPVRRAPEARKGVVHARNRGVAEARGAWIAFFDDDQLADRHWLATLWQTARKQNVRCVGGAVRLRLPDGVDNNLDPVCRMLLGETVGLEAPRDYNRRVTPGAGNLIVHRSIFEEIGGFDPAFCRRGEDTDLFLRMLDAGIRARFTPRAVVQHVIPAERLDADYLLHVTELLVEGLARDERDAWGRLRYPFVWAARAAQAGLLLVPRFVWAGLRNDAPRRLGARCRLRIAGRYLSDGWRLMFSRGRSHAKAESPGA